MNPNKVSYQMVACIKRALETSLEGPKKKMYEIKWRVASGRLMVECSILKHY